jgi:hypothetical protein
MLQMRLNQAAFASNSMSLKKLTQKFIVLDNKNYFCNLAKRLQPENPFSRICKRITTLEEIELSI